VSEIGSMMTIEKTVRCPSYSLGQPACAKMAQGLISARPGSGRADGSSIAQEAPQ
jgi:hypothetical protein